MTAIDQTPTPPARPFHFAMLIPTLVVNVAAPFASAWSCSST
jgi:hypothetical protein